jgi:hypothetical protein
MPIKKGDVLNPTGFKGDTKRTQKQLKELLIHLVPDCIRELEDMIKDPAFKQFAIKEILDRVHGKAPQGVEVTGADGQPLSITVNVINKK